MKNLYTLHIAINNYHPQSSVSSLSGCHQDIDSMHSFLEKAYSHYSIHSKCLIDKEATYNNIIDHFGEKHLLKAQKGDIVLIQYSGHGAREKAAPKFERDYPEGKQETLVCYDSRTVGKYDLADKELGVLIHRIASKGVHVVVILDCCHAGSATRSQEDIELGDARQWDDSEYIRRLDSYLNGYFLDNEPLPNSQHILLAACDKRQKAYELRHKGGRFTSHLLELLEESKGNISYAELFARLQINMKRISTKQIPQLEPYGFFNARSKFLGIGEEVNQHYFEASFDSDKICWKINGGVLQGISTAPDKSTTFNIYRKDKLLGHARSTFVKMQESEIRVYAKLDKRQIYRAKMTSLPDNKITVDLKVDEKANLRLSEVLHSDAIGGGKTEGYRPLYFDLVKEASFAPFQLNIKNEEAHIIRQSDNTKIASAMDLNDGALAFLFEKLEHICRWEKLLAIENQNSYHKDFVKLYLLELDEQGKEIRETSEMEVNIEILVENYIEKKVPFRLEVRNDSKYRWYCALYYFHSSYGIHSIYNEEIEANSTTTIMEFNEKGERFKFELNGKSEATDIFKIIVSRQKIKQEQLVQKGIRIGDVAPRGVTKDLGHSKGEVYEHHVLNDWFAHVIKCKPVARRKNV